MSNVAHDLKRATEAAKRLLSHLREIGEADDEEIVETAVEGETGLFEVVGLAMDEIDECEVHIAGLKSKEEDFGNRRAAKERRAEMLRAAIEQAMVSAEVRKINLATRTVYLSERAPNVIVENEADIPARFWITPPAPAPKLDKRALKAALKAKEIVPGAKLDNGSVTLNLRK